MKPQFSPNFEKAQGLITAVTVDADNGEVLMVAYMNEEAFRLTLKPAKFITSRVVEISYGKKGESSGNMQDLVEMRVDCDLDAVVVRAKQKGPACHDGFKSCFYRTVVADGSLVENAIREMTPEQMYGGQS